ncbi:MAG: GxxExxY protein [Planctomycetes bacterium]|nr:GxxExxY protein [Planctomycetota bacterium]
MEKWGREELTEKIIVEDEIMVELKTVEDLNKKYYVQVRSYLKAMKKDIGLLVNFADFTIDVRRVESKRRKD